MGEERTEALRIRVAAALGQQALKDRDLARLAGVDIHTVGRLLNEDRGITRHSAAKIAGALGMSLEAAVAPLRCRACRDMPPAGYRCLACGAETPAGEVVPVTEAEPVRLTFPLYDFGAADILANGKRAGICLDEGRGVWRAYLYPVLADRRVRADGCEELTARTLGELRRVLRERVELKGPWWT